MGEMVCISAESACYIKVRDLTRAWVAGRNKVIAEALLSLLISDIHHNLPHDSPWQAHCSSFASPVVYNFGHLATCGAHETAQMMHSSMPSSVRAPEFCIYQAWVGWLEPEHNTKQASIGCMSTESTMTLQASDADEQERVPLGLELIELPLWLQGKEKSGRGAAGTQRWAGGSRSSDPRSCSGH